MARDLGRRERKKQRTRQSLIEAAVRLFEERGYDGTTVLDIAEAADVSDRTFFLHFRTKEDVILGSTEQRRAAALRAVVERGPDDSVGDVLERAVIDMVDDAWREDVPAGLAALRVRLLATVPAVQARLLQRLLLVQADLIEAVHRAWPDRVSRIEAAALVGAVLGAVNAVAISSLASSDQPERAREDIRRAVRIALYDAGSLAAIGGGKEADDR